ncbi:hypothetical protein BCT81_02170 [Vibrio sp. 10N.261.52.A1]|nr:hypothetical protein BCT81_02170 [Vibrio sp. 10N.261.52.A1]
MDCHSHANRHGFYSVLHCYLVQYAGRLVNPAALVTVRRPEFGDRILEPKRTVADSQHWGDCHRMRFQLYQDFQPAGLRLTVPGNSGQDFLAPLFVLCFPLLLEPGNAVG